MHKTFARPKSIVARKKGSDRPTISKQDKIHKKMKLWKKIDAAEDELKRRQIRAIEAELAEKAALRERAQDFRSSFSIERLEGMLKDAEERLANPSRGTIEPRAISKIPGVPYA